MDENTYLLATACTFSTRQSFMQEELMTPHLAFNNYHRIRQRFVGEQQHFLLTASLLLLLWLLCPTGFSSSVLSSGSLPSPSRTRTSEPEDVVVLLLLLLTSCSPSSTDSLAAAAASPSIGNSKSSSFSTWPPTSATMWLTSEEGCCRDRRVSPLLLLILFLLWADPSVLVKAWSRQIRSRTVSSQSAARPAPPWPPQPISSLDTCSVVVVVHTLSLSYWMFLGSRAW